MEIAKGQYGYIHHQKKWYFIKMLLGTFAFFLLLLLGLFLYDTKANIMTAIAMFVLVPIAVWVVRFILFFRFRSGEIQYYNEIKDCIYKKENVIFMTDLLLTHQNGICYIPFVIIKDGTMFGYINNNQSVKTVCQYLENILMNKGLTVELKIYNNYESYINAIKECKQNDYSENQVAIKNQLLLHCI